MAEIFEIDLFKAGAHKYIKRTGTPGNYRYWYKLSDGRIVSSDDANSPIDHKKAKIEHLRRLIQAKAKDYHSMSKEDMMRHVGVSKEDLESSGNKHIFANAHRRGHQYDEHEIKTEHLVDEQSKEDVSVTDGASVAALPSSESSSASSAESEEAKKLLKELKDIFGIDLGSLEAAESSAAPKVEAASGRRVEGAASRARRGVAPRSEAHAAIARSYSAFAEADRIVKNKIIDPVVLTPSVDEEIKARSVKKSFSLFVDKDLPAYVGKKKEMKIKKSELISRIRALRKA
jgi:hypothetical protein